MTAFDLALLPSAVTGILKLVATVIVFYAVGRFAVKPLVYRAAAREADYLSLPAARVSMYATVLLGVGVGLAVGGYGPALGAFSTIAAAATLAIGFAMRDTLAAVVAGVFLFFDRPFKIGDAIEWEDNAGTVKDIRLRVTKVETFDNEVLTVPNDRIGNATVRNLSANRKRRRKLVFGIGYEEDIDAAKKHILKILDRTEGILDNPQPQVLVENLGDSTVDLKAYYWVRRNSPRRVLTIKDTVLQAVKQKFEAEGIDMPFPTQTVNGELQVNK